MNRLEDMEISNDPESIIDTTTSTNIMNNNLND